MDLTRFIIIAVPPPDLAERLQHFKSELSEVTGSMAALMYPPHVTLRTGALVPGNCVPDFVSRFGEAAGKIDACVVESAGIDYGTYGQEHALKYFLYFRIRQTAQIMDLHKKLIAYKDFQKGEQYPFRPHLTIVFDDISLDGIRKGLEYIRCRPDKTPPDFTFVVDSVALYTQHDFTWEPHSILLLRR